MKVGILAGVLGTRLSEETTSRPKPMGEIGGRPILWYITKIYAMYGVSEFVVALSYKAEVIQHYFLNYRNRSGDLTICVGEAGTTLIESAAEDWPLYLSTTGDETMTGGRVKTIAEFIGDEPFMLTYGDGLSDINLDALLAHHRSKDLAVTVTGVRPPARFGELQIDSDGIASGFNEKPQASAGMISGGFFVCEHAVFDHMNSQENLVFEQDPMQSLVSKKLLFVYQHDGFWQCMDTFRDWQLLNSMIDQEKAPWKVW